MAVTKALEIATLYFRGRTVFSLAYDFVKIVLIPRLKKDRQRLLALTGLTRKEFVALPHAFRTAYATVYPEDKTADGSVRKRQAGGGRKGQLSPTEQKLLFSLVYQKTYPLQVLLGEIFGLSQSRANRWIHRLLPILGSN